MGETTVGAGVGQKPHDLSQAEKLDHAVSVQSIGHEVIAHSRSSLRLGQSLPPKLVYSTTVRKRRSVPVPQVREQDSQSPKDVTAQSTGQPKSLHVSDSWRCGQTKPPYCACLRITRVRVCLPEPHSAVHELHADQSDVVQ